LWPRCLFTKQYVETSLQEKNGTDSDSTLLGDEEGDKSTIASIESLALQYENRLITNQESLSDTYAGDEDMLVHIIRFEYQHKVWLQLFDNIPIYLYWTGNQLSRSGQRRYIAQQYLYHYWGRPVQYRKVWVGSRLWLIALFNYIATLQSIFCGIYQHEIWLRIDKKCWAYRSVLLRSDGTNKWALLFILRSRLNTLVIIYS